VNKEENTMKRLMGLVVAVIALAVVLVPHAWAQGGDKWRGSGGWGPGGQYMRLYDPSTVESISGEVIRVERVSPMRGMSAGIHLVVRTESGEISAHLGPQWYLDNQDVKLAPGDRVQIKGSRVTLGGKLAIIAAEVKKGDDTLKLRDDAGVAAWSGWRRG
jgi:hypothetical protein